MGKRVPEGALLGASGLVAVALSTCMSVGIHAQRPLLSQSTLSLLLSHRPAAGAAWSLCPCWSCLTTDS